MHSFIIAAVSDNGVIGAKGDLIWDLPADQAFFFNRIKAAQLLTRRLSFESEHGTTTFQNRDQVIILTSQEDYGGGKIRQAQTMDQAWQIALASDYEELAVLGGAKVYEEALSRVDTLYITEVHAEFEGDTFFPEID